MREKAISPLPRVRIQYSIKGILVHRLRVDNVCHAALLFAVHLDKFERSQEHFPSRRFSRATGADQHQAMVQFGDLVQLEHLFHPQIALFAGYTRVAELQFGADLCDCFFEPRKFSNYLKIQSTIDSYAGIPVTKLEF